MRILLVTPYVPHRAVGHGAATVTSSYFEHFSSRHELWVLSFHYHPRELDLASSLSRRGAHVQSIPFEVDSKRLAVARARSLVERLPLQISCFRSRAMSRAIRDVLDRAPFDLVQMDLPWMGQYIRGVDVGRARTVLMELDVAIRPLERLWRTETSPWKRLWRHREWRAMTRFEPALCAEFDRVYAVSDEDRELLLSLDPDLEVSRFRYGVEEKLLGLGPRASSGNRILFLGSYLHPPNRDATFYLCDEILPRVREQIPEAELVLAGGSPPAEVRALGERRGITVSGWVDDLSTLFAQADVGVVPLRLGGGVKLKTLEMMAAGLPVVTTSVGREGISGSHRAHFWLADEPGAFAEGIVTLLRNRRVGASMADAGRALVHRDHRWGPNLARLEKELVELVNERRSTE